MSDIVIADVTNATTGDDGTGSLDVLMQAFERHIVEQYDEGRITGVEYATVYLGGFKSVLDAAMSFAMTQEKAGAEADIALEGVNEATAKTDLVLGQVAKIYADTALTEQQQITELAQTTNATGGHMLAKQELIDAQALGFASDTKQKVLKQMFEGYAVNLSISNSGTVPDSATEPAIDALVFEILGDVGSTALGHSGGAPDIGA